MANYIFFGIYLLLITGIFGFLTIFMMHIRDYRQYSRYLTGITRFYLILMVIIAINGGYFILKGDIFPQGSVINRIKNPVQNKYPSQNKYPIQDSSPTQTKDPAQRINL